MKKSLIMLWVGVVLCGCKTSKEPEKIKHILKENNKVNCEIVAPAEAGPVAAFAAKEMKKIMDKSLDADIAILKTPSGKKTAIILGDNKFARDAGIDISKLPRDGFIIKSVGNNIFIAGKDDMNEDPQKRLRYGVWAQLYERATLFGAYDFLERYLGARFYFPGEIGTFIPKNKTLKLPEMDMNQKPDYTFRKFSLYSGKTPAGKDGKESFPFKNLNAYRLRIATNYIPNCHSFSRLGFIERFAQTHPEYFALMDTGRRHNNPALRHPGQICLSSPIKQVIYKDAEAYLTGKTAKERGVFRGKKYGYSWSPSAFQPGYFNLMPQDGFYKCHCEKCQKHFSQGEQATSDFIWDFICDIARELKKNNIPGHVTAMAYDCYRPVPNVDIPDNVMVMVAVRGPWTLKFKNISEREDKFIKDWDNKLNAKVWLWNYCNKYGKLNIPNVPDMTPKAIGRYYQKQKPYILGAYMESETDKYIFHYLSYYVFSKVAWNNDADVESILNEHYQKMFGKGALPMKEVYESFEEKWLKIKGKPIDTPLGPSCVPISDYELWEKIYSQKEIESLEDKFASAEKLTANDMESNKRVKFMRKHLLGSLKTQRQTYLNNKKEIEDFVFLSNKTNDSEIKLDGKLDENAWKDTEEIYLRPFYAKEKDKIQVKKVKTKVKSLKGNEYIFFAFECEEPEMSINSAKKRKFDDKHAYNDSSIEIFLNPSGDRKDYCQIIVNALGSVSDLSGKKIGAGGKIDWDWNSGTKAAVGRTPEGWTLEIAVPIKNLKGFRETGFPVNFNRNRALLSDAKDYVVLYTWSPFLRNGFHDLQNFGSVVFEKKNDNNIIKNSDFQGKVRGRFFDGWYAPKSINAGCAWKLDSDTFIKGGKSLMLECRPEAKVIITQYLPKLEPDTEYLLTFFVKTEGIVPSGKSTGAYVNIWDDKNCYFPINYYTGSIPWTKQGFQFKTGPATNKDKRSYIRLCIRKAAGKVWFDDVRLRKIEK
jgi:hypothetical protein